MRTSHHIAGGFWAHISWNEKQTAGLDQNGRRWTKVLSPECDNTIVKPLCEMYGSLVALLLKQKP